MQQKQTPRQTATPAVATHKLIPPAPFACAVQRTKVLDKLVGEGVPHVSFLQAPAGFGKSTLLQQAKAHCDAQDELTAWLTLDEADNDAIRMLSHLQAMAQVVNGTQPAAVTRQEQKYDDNVLRPDWFINTLLGTGRPVTIFFDEFQTLTDVNVLGWFQLLLEQAPATVRIMIGSRSVTNLNLSRLYVNNQASILQSDDLSFSREETQLFFSADETPSLSDSEISMVHEYTEGWPAALQLYRLALADPGVRLSLSDRTDMQLQELTEYLANNVLRLQSSDVQSFLLNTAPLTQLSADLCDDILGLNNSESILNNLESGGLFLRKVGTTGRWYRYHSLFATFLVDRLQRQHTDTLVGIHERAARWFREEGFAAEAMHHACASGDYRMAAQTLEEWGAELISQGRLRTVERWYRQIPADEAERLPDLTVIICYALIFTHHNDRLPHLLKLLDDVPKTQRKRMRTSPEVVQSMAAIIAYDDLPSATDKVATVPTDESGAKAFRAFELAAAANLQAFLTQSKGQFEATRNALALARNHSDRGHAKFSDGYTISLKSMNLLSQCKTQEALDVFATGASRRVQQMNDSLSSAVIEACHLRVLYEVDRIDEAVERFEKYKDVIMDSAPLDWLATAAIIMARIHIWQGSPAQAAKVLGGAERIAHRCRWRRLQSIIDWERVRQAIVSGDIGRAGRIAAEIRRTGASPSPEWLTFSEETNGQIIGDARLAIYKGHHAKALELIADEMSFAARCGRTQRQIKLYLLKALAHHLMDDQESTHTPLQRALRLAAPAGMIRTFLEEGDVAVELLQKELPALGTEQPKENKTRTLQDFIRTILSAAGISTELMSVGNAADQLVEPLTDRENDVLRQLSEGSCNKTIAKTLFVSDNTVKFHLKNIYSKLGVTSRIQATAAGRKIGII